ncbi:MAG: hypothetical protein J5617_02135 [Bacilli bacterium]|nr:hypothetical protein [Bacilli bacterium]
MIVIDISNKSSLK